jgi:hypothetical protein
LGGSLVIIVVVVVWSSRRIGQRLRPAPEKILGQVDAIRNSIERCAKITHHLLGFAKRMAVTQETIDLRRLIREVLSFPDREGGRRVNPEARPTIGEREAGFWEAVCAALAHDVNNVLVGLAEQMGGGVVAGSSNAANSTAVVLPRSLARRRTR